jgi:transketolase
MTPAIASYPSTSTAVAPALDVAASKARCAAYRRRILEISQGVPALHIGGAFSAMELMDCVYSALMRRHPDGSTPDTFILSKGHAAIGQYVVLEGMGILSRQELDRYCKPGGRLGGHPDYGVPGIEASTGSLGHGMGLAIGMAHADRILKADRRIYVVMSDGELQEGSVWETMMMAANLGVANLTAFVDHNGFQSFGRTTDNHPAFYPIAAKIRAFGWECVEVDGHDVAAVHRAVTSRTGDRPFMVVANTVKGKGVSYMENVPMWHFRSPNAEEYAQALAELGAGSGDGKAAADAK